MTTIRHSLTNRDEAALKATCSVCGPGADILLNGQRGFVCATAKREGRARYKQAHPDRAKENRRFKPSSHRLQSRKGGADICAICGPVESIAHGWGYMCPNRAKELGWKPEEAPAPLCPTCKSRHLDKMGACPLCDEPLPDYDRRRPGQEWDPYDEFYEAGLSVRDDFADLEDEIETAVPGWKTLGFHDTGVRPEYAALYGGSR